MRKRTEVEEQNNKFAYMWGRLQHVAIIQRTKLFSFGNRPGSKYHSRCFNLPARGSPEPAQWLQ